MIIHRSKYAIHAVGKNRAEGILIPWGVRTSYGTFFTPSTDLGLDVFRVKPVFNMHGISGDIRSHGEITDIERRDVGLWIGTDIDDDAVEIISSMPAGWSAGALPQMLAITSNGRVTLFVLLEASFGHEDKLANPPGSTTAHLQAYVDEQLSEEVEIQRSIWIMSPKEAPIENRMEMTITDDPATPEQIAAAELYRQSLVERGAQDVLEKKLLAGITTSLPAAEPVGWEQILGAIQQVKQGQEAILNRVTDLEDAPTRVLPAKPEPDPEPKPEPRITVASKYDDQTIGRMVFEDHYNASLAHHDVNHYYARTDEWWRAVIGKMSDHIKEVPMKKSQLLGFDEKGGEVLSIPDNLVSEKAYEAFHAYVPHLYADEAMRVDFTAFGLELVPTLFSTVMYHFFLAESKVWANLTRFRPTSFPNFSWPKITSGPVFRRVLELADESQLDSQSSPIPSSKMGTGNVDFVAGSIGARVIITDQLLRGSAPNMMEAAFLQFTRQTAAEIDWILMNGDETASAANISHLADPTDTVYDKALVVDGLRHMTIITTTADSQAEATIAITSPGIGRALMGARGRIGDDIKKIIMFAAPESARKFYALSNYQSISDVGRELSTLIHGVVGFITGVPLIPTDSIELADSDGKYEATHASGTVGQLVFVHSGVVRVAEFQELRFENEFTKHARAWELSTTVDLDIQQMENGGTADLYNNTV